MPLTNRRTSTSVVEDVVVIKYDFLTRLILWLFLFISISIFFADTVKRVFDRTDAWDGQRFQYGRNDAGKRFPTYVAFIAIVASVLGISLPLLTDTWREKYEKVYRVLEVAQVVLCVFTSIVGLGLLFGYVGPEIEEGKLGLSSGWRAHPVEREQIPRRNEFESLALIGITVCLGFLIVAMTLLALLAAIQGAFRLHKRRKEYRRMQKRPKELLEVVEGAPLHAPEVKQGVL